MKPNRFRFRAWDADHGKMITKSGSCAQDAIRIDTAGRCKWLLGNDESGALVPMQSTGLADRNGKEIFEGDVIEFSDEEHWQGQHAIVTGQVGVVVRNDSGLYVAEPQEVALCDMLDAGVIGNIYENPELMKMEVMK